MEEVSYKSIDLLCSECGHEWHDLVERDLVNATHQCPDCGKQAGLRTMSLPNVTRASYPDGHKRGGGYQELKEVAKLKGEMMNQDIKGRGDITREIKKLGGSIK